MSLPSPGSSEFVVEVSYDHEAGLWFYTVDALNIIGTGCLTREHAEKYVLEAIEFTLEAEDDDPPESAEILTYDVQIAKAS